MSRVPVHNFSISLDGFGTGEGQSFDAPFGHAQGRLMEWFFATRTHHAMQGKSGGGTGIDETFARKWARASARRSWVGTNSARSADHGPTMNGEDGGATTRSITRRSSSSPASVRPALEMDAGRRFTSSIRASQGPRHSATGSGRSGYSDRRRPVNRPRVSGR